MQMGATYDETVRKVDEESGITRGGERFRQEKRQMTGEGPTMIKMKDHKGIPHRLKWPHSDDEEDHTTPRVEAISNPNNNVPTPMCTTLQEGRNTS